MGDRCHVTIEIRPQDEKAAEAVFQRTPDSVGRPYDSKDYPSEGVIQYEFEECNYGRVGVEQSLMRAGVPFDKRASGGSEYSPFDAYCRFDENGEASIQEFYEGEELLDPGTVMQWLNSHDDPAEALAHAKEQLTEHVLRFEVKSLEKQPQEHIRKYLVMSVVAKGAA